MSVWFMARRVALAIFVCVGLCLASAGSSVAMTPSGTWSFKVIRDGDPIGTHQMAFSGSGVNLQLDVHTRIAVKLMLVTVYRFEHDGQEDWQNGQLVSLSTKTNDDGKKHQLSLRRENDSIVGVGDGHSISAPGDMLTGSLWNENLVRDHALINTLTGQIMNITVQDLGSDQVPTVSGGTLAARHYKISGQLEREIWFDSDGRMVKLAFLGDDKSKIVYLLQ